MDNKAFSVLLINPATPAYLPNKEFVIPISLLYLAAALEQAGYVATILDLNIYRPWDNPEFGEKWWEPFVLDKIQKQNPGLIGIGCLFSGQFDGVLQIALSSKKHFNHIPIAVGGMHPTVFAHKIISNCPDIDYAIIGEGENQFVELANCIYHRNWGQLDRIEGVALRKNKIACVQNKKTYLEDLDSLSLPSYHLIKFGDYAHNTSHWHNPKGLEFNLTVPLISSRSCPSRCSFCSMYQVMGPRLRMRSANAVVDEIAHLYYEHGLSHFSFMDDNLNLNKKHVLSVCDEIQKQKLDIQYETPNGLSVANLDPEVIAALVASGWIRGAIAVESGSDFIRNQIMGKRLPRRRIYEVVEAVKRYPQVYLKAFFIIGMPEETVETLQATYDMISELDVHEVVVTNLMPFAGTRVFSQAMRDNLFNNDFDFENLWKSDGFHYHNNERFYIKPYRLTPEELATWREKFTNLVNDVHSKGQC